MNITYVSPVFRNLFPPRGLINTRVEREKRRDYSMISKLVTACPVGEVGCLRQLRNQTGSFVGHGGRR